MPFALPAAAIDLPAFDVRPAIEVVAEAPENSISRTLRDIADRHVPKLARIRLEMGALIRSYIADLAYAEKSGWVIDCSPVLEALDRRIGEDRSAWKAAERDLRAIISRAASARVPGANALNTHAGRIRSAINDLMNDFDDYRDDVSKIHKRMAALGDRSPIVRSGTAYEKAISEVFGVEASRDVELSSDLGGPYIRYNIPVSEKLLDDPDELLSVEERVHQLVSSQGNDLVGRVALNYTAS